VQTLLRFSREIATPKRRDRGKMTAKLEASLAVKYKSMRTGGDFWNSAPSVQKAAV
jgi:hypothetical protein